MLSTRYRYTRTGIRTYKLRNTHIHRDPADREMLELPDATGRKTPRAVRAPPGTVRADAEMQRPGGSTKALPVPLCTTGTSDRDRRAGLTCQPDRPPRRNVRPSPKFEPANRECRRRDTAAWPRPKHC